MSGSIKLAMKPRTRFSTLIVPARPSCMFARAQMQGSRSTHLQTIQRSNKSWNSALGAIRCASTSTSTSASTSTSTKPRYGIQPPPPPKPKTAKPSVPAKAKKSKSSPPAKRHTASATAATGTRTATPPTITTTTTDALVQANDKLNPPSFTYPPELSVPARKAGQNYASYLFSCGKAYLTFYKSGISHTRQTLKLAKALRAKLAEQGKGVSKDVAGNGILTRSEWQVLRRSKRDLLRLPVMGFLILALGEWLPVIVVYLTPVIPEACRIPQQVERTLRKLEARRNHRLTHIATDAQRLQARDRTPATDSDAIRLAAAAEGLLSPETKSGKSGGIAMAHAIVPPQASQELSLFHLLLLSARLNCHPRILDLLHLLPPKWMLQRNVSKTLAYLARDDALIRRDGGAQALAKQELLRACVERGIPVLGRSEAEQRTSLTQWYDM